MREMFWDSALLVRLQNGVERIFSGPYDTLDFLENEWPVRKVQAKRTAEDCRAVLEGAKSTNIARDSFILACIEAGLPVSRCDGSKLLLTASLLLQTVDFNDWQSRSPRRVA